MSLIAIIVEVNIHSVGPLKNVSPIFSLELHQISFTYILTAIQVTKLSPHVTVDGPNDVQAGRKTYRFVILNTPQY